MPNLPCTEFERRLEAAIEERRLPEAALREHAAGCERCRAAWEQYALLDDAIAAWRAGVPDVDLADAILSRLAFDSQTTAPAPLAAQNLPAAPSRRRARWVAVASASAAALFAALLLSPLARVNDAPEVARDQPVLPSAAPVIPSTPDPAEPSAPVVAVRPAVDENDDDAELTLLVRDAGSAYLGLANGAAEAVAQGAVLLPAVALVSGDGATADEAPASWVDQFRRDLTPIGRNIENALEFLLDAVPAEPPPAT